MRHRSTAVTNRVQMCALIWLGGCAVEQGDRQTDVGLSSAPLSEQRPAGSDKALEQRRRDFIEHWDAVNSRREIIAELETSDGQRFHCIPAAEDLATPPPPPAREEPLGVTRTARQREGLRCPQGTIATVVFDPREYLEHHEPPAKGFSVAPPKKPLPLAATNRSRPQGRRGGDDGSPPPIIPTSSGRYYVAWGHVLTNYGTRGILNHWKVPEHSNDNEISLLQVAVASTDGNGDAETVEAGFAAFNFQKSPETPLSLGEQVFFTYFTTAGHGGGATYDVRGYGWECEEFLVPGCGFVHWTGASVVPGELVDGSTPGSQNQEECYIEVQHYQGNWWIYACDGWVGYYPGFLYDSSMEDSAQQVLWYGEVSTANNPNATVTDMGSAQHAFGETRSSGYGTVQYIRNIKWISATGNPATYNWIEDAGLNQPLQVTDRPCYSGAGPFTNGGSAAWRNYFLLGGPGLGGADPDPMGTLPNCQ